MGLGIGDKVLLRNDLECGKEYGSPHGAYFADGMKKGVIVVVKKCYNFYPNTLHFRIEAETDDWFYTLEMCVGKIVDDNRLEKII